MKWHEKDDFEGFFAGYFLEINTYNFVKNDLKL